MSGKQKHKSKITARDTFQSKPYDWEYFLKSKGYEAMSFKEPLEKDLSGYSKMPCYTESDIESSLWIVKNQLMKNSEYNCHYMYRYKRNHTYYRILCRAKMQFKLSCDFGLGYVLNTETNELHLKEWNIVHTHLFPHANLGQLRKMYREMLELELSQPVRLRALINQYKKKDQKEKEKARENPDLEKSRKFWKPLVSKFSFEKNRFQSKYRSQLGIVQDDDVSKLPKKKKKNLAIINNKREEYLDKIEEERKMKLLYSYQENEKDEDEDENENEDEEQEFPEFLSKKLVNPGYSFNQLNKSFQTSSKNNPLSIAIQTVAVQQKSQKNPNTQQKQYFFEDELIP